MIKKLVTIGCSWTAGAELDDPLSQAYPALISKHYGWDLEVQTESDATLSRMLLAFTSWLTSHTKEEINETFFLIGLTDERRGAIDPESNFINSIEAFDHFANEYNAKILQFKVLSNLYKTKVPSLIDSSSALEMLVIRNKPRKDPLFMPHKHPNKKGHQLLADFLIEKIDSVIL